MAGFISVVGVVMGKATFAAVAWLVLVGLPLLADDTPPKSKGVDQATVDAAKERLKARQRKRETQQAESRAAKEKSPPRQISRGTEDDSPAATIRRLKAENERLSKQIQVLESRLNRLAELTGGVARNLNTGDAVNILSAKFGLGLLVSYAKGEFTVTDGTIVIDPAMWGSAGASGAKGRERLFQMIAALFQLDAADGVRIVRADNGKELASLSGRGLHLLPEAANPGRQTSPRQSPSDEWESVSDAAGTGEPGGREADDQTYTPAVLAERRREIAELLEIQLKLASADEGTKKARIARAKSELDQLPDDDLRELLVEADTRNREMDAELRVQFGSKEAAAQTVLKHLKSRRVIDDARIIRIEEAAESNQRGRRRQEYQPVTASATCEFEFQTRAGLIRRTTGFIIFIKMKNSQGIFWKPFMANIDGTQERLEDQFRTRPNYATIEYEGGNFVVN
jgi:hypothetical protein